MNSQLKEYIEQQILSRYAHFDAAHQQSHAETVIANSFAIARHYEVDLDMVYVVAAYHDIGLCQGRENHHLVSGRMLRADTRLRQWFNEDQIAVMAEAVEDHRASSKQPPRSLYGCIVAEADRNIDSEEIVRRTIQYGLSHYPTLTDKEQWLRCLAHLKEKYGRGGYLTLWLPESPNAAPLQELQQLIEDEARLRTVYKRILSSL